jgi:hypothetical protein
MCATTVMARDRNDQVDAAKRAHALAIHFAPWAARVFAAMAVPTVTV